MDLSKLHQLKPVAIVTDFEVPGPRSVESYIERKKRKFDEHIEKMQAAIAERPGCVAIMLGEDVELQIDRTPNRDMWYTELIFLDQSILEELYLRSGSPGTLI